MAVKTDNLAKERLLDAAEELFAAKGFDGTSIRDLTARAKCNLAAVNYHFGSKEQLYRNVFERKMNALRDVRIGAIENVMSRGSDVTLEELLYTFTRSFIEPLLSKKGGQSLMRLMSREMLEAHLPRSLFIEKIIIPTVTVFGQALMQICPALNETNAQLVILSIVGQLLHTVQMQEMFEPAEANAFTIDIDIIVDHIVKFSAAGIRAYEKGNM